MKLDIEYSKKSIKFLRKNPHVISKQKVSQLVSQAVKKLHYSDVVNIDLQEMRGKWKNFYRIKHGKIRIIFSIKGREILVASVNDIDFRGSIYKK